MRTSKPISKMQISKFLLIVGIIFVILGYIFRLFGQDQAAHDTVPATATVTDYVEDSELRGRIYVTVYYPVMTYEVDGQVVASQYSESSEDKAYQIGDSVDIKYNPELPGEFIIVGDDVDTGTSGVFMIGLGAIMAVVGLVWTIINLILGRR